MVEAGFLATETRRRTKGRPAKVYFTWEGEASSLEEAGVDVPEGERLRETADQIKVELRVLERMLADASQQIGHLKELLEAQKEEK
jgi:hypothetical protein